MIICSVCKRESSGFGYIKPPLRAGDPRNHKKLKRFCSRRCQEIFTNYLNQNPMIDLTKTEKEAIESALKSVGEYVADIGMNRPLADYSREEVLCLIEVAVGAYTEFMKEQEIATENLEVFC